MPWECRSHSHGYRQLLHCGAKTSRQQAKRLTAVGNERLNGRQRRAKRLKLRSFWRKKEERKKAQPVFGGQLISQESPYPHETSSRLCSPSHTRRFTNRQQVLLDYFCLNLLNLDTSYEFNTVNKASKPSRAAMNTSRAPFALCPSPNAPAGEEGGSVAITTNMAESAGCLFSPFSPMDSRNQENTTR